MEPAVAASSVQRDADLLAEAVRHGRDAAVPACPGWTVADLATHVGAVHRWAGDVVRTAATTGRSPLESHDPADPELAEWVSAGARQLGAVLTGTDPDTPVWTMGEPRTARFWVRRMAEETAVHRWDAQAASGTPDPIEADLAAEGVAEMLEVFTPRVHRRGAAGAGESFHFHRTDGPGEWLVRFDADGAHVTAEHAKAAVAFRGPAPELLLVLWRRRPLETVEVFGDPATVARWFELVPPL